MIQSLFGRAPSPSNEATRTAPVVLPMNSGKPTLATVFATEESPLLGFAVGLVGRRSVAEELVQDAFLRLHELWAQVENPQAWLYRTVRNLALNYLRDHRRETLVEQPEELAHDRPPDDAIGRMEAIGMVRMLIAEMASDDRDLIRLTYHDDLKYQEISERTRMSVGNVGYRLHHLLKGLADSLRHAGIEGSQG